MSYYTTLSPLERLKRISELLLRGISLHAKENGWIQKPSGTQNSCLKKTHKNGNSQAIVDNSLEEEIVSTKQFYTLAETAEILSINKRTLQRWIKSGRIKAIKQDNGYLVIEQEEVNCLIDVNL